MKRKLLIISFLLAAMAGLFGQAKPATHMAIAPPAPSYSALAYYDFDSNANDATGNGNTAATSNMSYGTGTPAAGTAYGDFSTTTPSFILPAGVTATTAFTWSFWFRQSNGGGYYELVDPHADHTNYEYYFIWLDGVQGDIEFRGYQTSTNTLDIARSNTSVWTPAFVWNHLIVTYDNGTVTMYYNGVELTMADGTTHNAANLKFGDQPRIGENFSGGIDEVSYFDYAVSGAEKILLWNGGVPGYIL